MAIFVFLNLPARGHINPTLPIVNELVARGHDVHYFTGKAIEGLLRRRERDFTFFPHCKGSGIRNEIPPSPPATSSSLCCRS